MVMMMSMPGVRHVQTALRAAAGLILHLYRRMVDLIVLLKEVMNSVEQRIVVVRRYDLNVQGHERFFTD